MERRELIRWAAAGSGVRLQALSARDTAELGREVHREAARPAAAAATLDPHQRRAVTIAAERILPGGDTPGATDAGVAAFVDRMLSDWYAPGERDAFLAGLGDLDRRARARGGRDFADCAENDQLAVLTGLDSELTALRANPGTANPDAHWFAILKYLTVWGYCTSEAGARQLGLDTLPMRYDGCAPFSPRPAP